MGRVKVHVPGGESGALVTGTYYGTGGVGKRAINVGFRPTRLDLCGINNVNSSRIVLLLICSNSCFEVSAVGASVIAGTSTVKITDTGFEVGNNQYSSADFNAEACLYQYTAFK